MWYWEVVYKTKDGNLHSLYSLVGFKTQREAYEDLIAHDNAINDELKNRGCVLLIDEQIVFKKTSLY